MNPAGNNGRLRIAMQKSGRLSDSSQDLFKRCGLRFSADRDRLIWVGENLPVDIMLVRDDDIPGLIADAHCDAGIVGLNLLRESALEREAAGQSAGFEPCMELDFGTCRLSLARQNSASWSGLSDLAGKRVATSYPYTLSAYLHEHGVQAEVVTLAGSVEIAPRLGKAEYICDLVSTGGTLAANDLQEVCTVLESQAVLVRATRTLEDEAEALLAKLRQRMRGVLQARESKYIMLHAPRAALAEVTRLLPGCEAPTVVPLEGIEDRVAVHAVCNEYVFWETLEALKSAGASAMLVLPVEKMMA